MWTRQQLKANGKMCFQRNYLSCVGAALLAGIFTAAGGTGSAASRYGNSAADPASGGGSASALTGSEGTALLVLFMSIAGVIWIAGTLLTIFVGNVLRVGANQFFIRNRMERPTVGAVFGAFRSGHYGNVVLTMFLKDLYVALWSLLLVIPGIIKSFEYYMVPYILAENPGMDRKEAFAISKRMMDGQKMDVFILELSFFGWALLGILTCGLGMIFYVSPYMMATDTELYAYLKAKAFEEGYIR